MQPLISVILPVFNGEEFISSSIDSILQQSLADFELLIINDGSTDSTKDIILSKKDHRLKYLENNNNQGLVKTLNKGLYLSKGKFIARMDADDVCLSTRFEKQIQYLLENKKVDILGTHQYTIGSDKTIIYAQTNEENKIRLLHSPPIGHSTAMIKKDSLTRNRLCYDRNAIFFTEDYKLWVDSSLSGLIIENIQEPLCGYRYHNKQSSFLYSRKQSTIANNIRMGYGKMLFNECISGFEREYLCFINGYRSQYDTSHFTRLADHLLFINNTKKIFDSLLFEYFLNTKLQVQKSHCF